MNVSRDTQLWPRVYTALVALLCLSLSVVTAVSQTVPAPSLPEIPPRVVEQFGPGIREQVRKAYDEARKHPTEANAVGQLGMILHTYEDHAAAISCYLLARKAAPREFQWAYLLGLAQAANGQPDEAKASLREALALRPDYAPAQLKLAELLLSSGDLAGSQQLVAAVSARQPDLAAAHYGLGRVKAAQHDFAAATVHYRKALDLSPRYGAAHYGLAQALRALGQIDKAAEHLALHQEYKLIRPTTPDPVWQTVTALNASAAALLKQGVELEAAGRLPEAITAHEQALAIDPQFEQVRLNLITLYARTGQTAKAEAHYRELQTINPNLAESHYNFGVLLLEQKRMAEAAAAFRRTLEINPQFAAAHLNYGVALEAQQQYDDALQQYRLAAEIQPNNRQAHFQLARMLIYKNLLPEAIAELQQTLTPQDDQTPRFQYALAAAYARAGDKPNALLHARAARDRAATLKQTELLAQIERDLKRLEEK